MAKIEFDFGGKIFEADVADSFLEREPQEQARILKQQLIDKYETRIPERGSDEKGVLDYLALLERPAQAVKVGLKESALGSVAFDLMGSVDLTPAEGMWTGTKRGWMGEDEVRTQDFLPDDMPPLARGLLGFAGDVATDPLTYFAPALVRGTGGLIKAVTPEPVKEGLKKAGKFAAEQKFGPSRIGLPDLARMFNVPMGVSRLVKGVGDDGREIAMNLDRQLADEMPKFDTYFKTRVKETGEDIEVIKTKFREQAQRERTYRVDEKGNPILDAEDGTRIYIDDDGNPLPLFAIDDSEKILGTEGARLLGVWEDVGHKLAKLSDAYGQPIQRVLHKGYFPGQLTAHGRKFVEEGPRSFISGVDELGQPIYRTGYRGGREEEALGLKNIDEVNRDHAEAMARHFRSHGRTPNPLDKPYEFFQTDPSIALGMRWSRQNLALQRKWFMDEITDATRVTGPMGWNPATKTIAFKEELGVGKWVKSDPDNPGQWLERVMDEDGMNYSWQRFADDPYEFREVSGLPKHFASDEVLDAEWVRVWTEQLRLRGLGRFHRMRFSDVEMAKLPEAYVEVKNLANAARLKMLNDTQSVFWAPKQVARQIEDQLSLMRGDIRGEKEIAKFLQFYDKTQNAWKAWTLGVRPAYHTRNAVGNMMNAYLVTGLGANIPEAIDIFTAAAKVQFYGRFLGSNVRRDEFLASVGPTRNLFAKVPPRIVEKEWTASNFMDTGSSMEELVFAARSRGISAGHYKTDNIRQLESTLEAQAGRGSVLSRTLGAENPAVQAGFGLGGTIEGNARYGVFIHTLRQIRKNPSEFKWVAPDGTKVSLSDEAARSKYFKTVQRETPEGPVVERVPITRRDMEFDVASQQVKGSQFDYMDVSKFERDFMKRMMPFYTWTRKNIPVQLKHLVLNPERAEKLHLAKEQFEYETGDLDWSDYGSFWGNRVPVFLGKENKGVVQAFTMLNIVPMADLQRMFRPKELVTEMVSPILKTSFEQLVNYDTFRKKPIKMFEGQTKDYFGVELSPRLWHLAQVIVPLTEINRLNPAGVFGERMKDPVTGAIIATEGWGGLGAMRETQMDAPEVARWIRFFTGGTTYDIDISKHRYIENRNILKDAAELMGKMKWSVKNTQNRYAKQVLEVLEALKNQKDTDPFDRR
jgi:hypothetical protein